MDSPQNERGQLPLDSTQGRFVSLSCPKENYIRQFLPEGKSVVDPSRDRTEILKMSVTACSAASFHLTVQHCEGGGSLNGLLSSAS